MPILFPRGRYVHPVPRSSLTRQIDCVDVVVTVDDDAVTVQADDDDATVDADEC